MSKRKPARIHKVRSTSNLRSKAARSRIAGHDRTRATSKQERVLALLRGANGATIATVMRTTGWQPHTVRGFLTGVVRKRLGLRLESEKTDGERVYRIVAGKNSADAGPLAGAPRIFLAAGATNLGLIKMRSTQAHSDLWCPEIAQLRPQIVSWSTLCRADWVRNDLVLTMRGWLLRHYHPVSLELREAMRSLMGLGKRGRLRVDRPTITG
jgi:hypothetical protein